VFLKRGLEFLLAPDRFIVNCFIDGVDRVTYCIFIGIAFVTAANADTTNITHKIRIIPLIESAPATCAHAHAASIYAAVTIEREAIVREGHQCSW
jgi:hypothetical protein